MKTLNRWIGLAAMAAFLAAGSSAYAGDCCKKTEENAKAGKACEKCVTDQCCKDTAKKVAAKGEAKACEKCAGKKDEKKPS